MCRPGKTTLFKVGQWQIRKGCVAKIDKSEGLQGWLLLGASSYATRESLIPKKHGMGRTIVVDRGFTHAHAQLCIVSDEWDFP